MSGLREELDRIRAKRGTLTPKVVVEEARRANHPLHSRFEWDDSVAAKRYREDQAGELIRSVMVAFPAPHDENMPTHSTRAYVSVARPAGREYVPVEEVAQDPVLSAIALAEAERDWRALYARYSHFEEFIDLVRASLASTR